MISIVRHFEAPRELVFQAWTDPRQLAWFAGTEAAQFVKPRPISVDLRVGGQWQVHMVESETRQYSTGGIYREIVEPERLVFAWGAVDGWPKLDPDRLDDFPYATVTLKSLGGGEATRMEFRLTFPDHFGDDEVKRWIAMGCKDGWIGAVDRLTEFFTT